VPGAGSDAKFSRPVLAGELRVLLQSAVTHLNGGDRAAAELCLNQVLSLDPNNPQATYLLGVVQFEHQRWEAAEALFRRAWAFSPGQPQVGFHWSQTLRALGRPRDARTMASAAHAAAPEHVGFCLELIKAEEESGAIEAAADRCRQLLVQHPTAAPVAIVLAKLLLRLRQQADAEQALRTTLAHLATDSTSDADRAELLFALATTIKRARRHREALECLERALVLAPGRPGAEADRASCLQHLQRFDDAALALRAELKVHPLNLDAHLQLNELFYRHQRDHSFLESYDVAAHQVPGSPLLLAVKGQWLLKVGRAPEARDSFERALRIDPNDPAALTGLQRALEALGEQRSALAQLEHTLQRHPKDPSTLVEGAGLLLRAGDAERACSLATEAHTLDATDQTALAVLGLCYRQLNRTEEYELNGYDSLIQIFDLTPPSGYTDMAVFNQQLASYLAGLHCDQREYFTQTARGGTRLFDEVFDNGHALVDRLKRRIDDVVARYVATLRGNAAHPFIARRTPAFLYNGSWSSTLKDRGFHVNHIHASGWISSAYYVAVPDVVNDASDQQGWLKFGEPGVEFGASFVPRRFVQPVAGRLVLFPSYLWHGTVPFHSTQTRTTIAFDVVPARSF
jgi:tetratricopeptide (TPR) repeat protein